MVPMSGLLLRVHLQELLLRCLLILHWALMLCSGSAWLDQYDGLNAGFISGRNIVQDTSRAANDSQHMKSGTDYLKAHVRQSMVRGSKSPNTQIKMHQQLPLFLSTLFTQALSRRIHGVLWGCRPTPNTPHQDPHRSAASYPG